MQYPMVMLLNIFCRAVAIYSGASVGPESLSLEEVCERYEKIVDEIGDSTDPRFLYPRVRNAAMLLQDLGKNGDRAALPFLESCSLATNSRELIRSTAAHAYVRVADVDEGLGLMQKLYADPTAQDSWRYFLNKTFVEKVRAQEKSLSQETLDRVYAYLVGQVQEAENSGNANFADKFLLERVPGYAASRQRATLTRYANTGNEWVTNTFNPIRDRQ